MTDHPMQGHYLRRLEKREPGFWGQAVPEDEATHAVIGIRHGPYETDLVFKWPEEKYNVAKVEAMLALAYERGYEDAQAAVRAALGVR